MLVAGADRKHRFRLQPKPPELDCPYMDLEEHVGVEDVKERCESCGAKLTDSEIEAALEGTTDMFLCSRCASERVLVEEEAEEL